MSTGWPGDQNDNPGERPVNHRIYQAPQLVRTVLTIGVFGDYGNGGGNGNGNAGGNGQGGGNGGGHGNGNGNGWGWL
jgi:hypothetical protein